MNKLFIEFDSQGTTCAGQVYFPTQRSKRPACIVMANGFSATMDWLLPDFAKKFTEAGFAVFTFDYRYFGRSGGQPRQLIDLRQQRIDLKNAVKWVRSNKDLDRDKIILWGTSLGGSHVVNLACADEDFAAVVCNMPAIDMIKGANTKRKAEVAGASRWDIAITTARLLGAGIYDFIRSVFNLSPYYLKVYGRMGEAIFTDPSIATRFDKVAKESETWRNLVTARSIFMIPRYREGTIEKITAPILLVLAAKDIEIDSDFTKEKFLQARKIKIYEYPYDHFSLYHGEAFVHVVQDQITFLNRCINI